MKKFASVALSALLSLSILAGCGGDSNTSTSTSTDTSTSDGGGEAKSAYKVAYLTPSMDIPFWRYMATGIEEKTKELAPDAEVQVYDSKDSADTQLKNAQDAIVKETDAIVISPVDSASCPAVLSLAEENGVPVVICDVGTDSGTYASFIITDNKGGAKELGEYVASLLQPGDKVAQITLNQARINGQLRKAGFEEGIAKNNLEQVDFRQMEKHNRQEGETFTQDLITAYPDLKCIFVQADDPSMGAVTALASAGRTDVMIAAFDFQSEYPEALKSGQMACAAAQQPVLMGQLAAEQINKLMNGETVEKEISVNTLLVTKDNIEELESNGGLDTVMVQE
ncbi:MAG: substrate-binding domain-containing protein [Eubacteriales bacterium]|jgi:ribose transport system substrate-binding protein